jgi:hypothetical protein
MKQLPPATYPRVNAVLAVFLVTIFYIWAALQEIWHSGLGRGWWADMKTCVAQIRTGKQGGELHLGDSYPAADDYE